MLLFCTSPHSAQKSKRIRCCNLGKVCKKIPISNFEWKKKYVIHVQGFQCNLWVCSSALLLTLYSVLCTINMFWTWWTSFFTGQVWLLKNTFILLKYGFMPEKQHKIIPKDFKWGHTPPFPPVLIAICCSEITNQAMGSLTYSAVLFLDLLWCFSFLPKGLGTDLLMPFERQVCTSFWRPGVNDFIYLPKTVKPPILQCQVTEEMQ